MLLKNVSKSMQTIASVLFVSAIASGMVFAQPVQCDEQSSKTRSNKLCSAPLQQLRAEYNEQFHTSYLVTDAPLQLLADSHKIWQTRLQQCKSLNCYKQQFSARIEDLNIYSSMNQSLTQHYLKFEHGKIAQPAIHLKLHQLSKDRIKVEGFAYRNPNNRLESQYVPLLAYTTPEEKTAILDNEHQCNYQLNFQKALLVVKTTQKGCERFQGIYRLYD